jgi:peptidoglycan biosynthesis protein MviN/MurJ (putative lipid II flippase)
VREVLGRLRTTLRLTALTSSRTFGALIVANTVAGGVVAFQIGLNFLWLPTALAARPLAVALQPVLSRLHHRGAAERFAAEYLRGLSVVLFLALPMTALYVALAEPIARVVASGQFDSPAGLALLSATLVGLGLGVAGDSAYVLSLYASFARDDVRSPYRAMLLGAAVGGAGMVAAAVLLDGRDTLLALGLAYALWNSVAAWRLARGLAAGLVRHLAGPGGPVLRALAGSAAMLLAAYPLAVVLPGAEPSRTVQTVALAAAVAVAAVVYAGVQRLLRSPELGAFTDAVRRRGGRSGEPEHGAAG